MRIWVIETGLPGVNNQCLGVARAIATLMPCRIEVVRARIRSKRLRPLALWALRQRHIGVGRKSILPKILTRMLFRGDFEVGAAPDIVITALGRSEYAAALFGGPDGAFAIHLGMPDIVPRSTFDFLILVNAEPDATDIGPHLHLSIYPTQVMRQDLKALAAPRTDRTPRWAVLVGGDGAHYHYTAGDFEVLGSELGRLADRLEARLLVTTSRRTGRDAEDVLAAALPSGRIECAVWYATNPQPVIPGFMANCDVVFCTADSRSMVADAIAAGRPVYAIRPPKAAPEPIHRQFLEIQEANRHLRSVSLSELGSVDVGADCHTWFKPMENCWSIDFLSALQATDFHRRFPRPPRSGGD